MYSYTKEKKFPKRKMIVSLFCLLAISVSYLSYEYYRHMNAKDTAVFKEENVPVLSLPASANDKIIKPFNVEAITSLEYFDGKDSDIENVTEFEGVYRGNQGIDYTYQEESFDVLASFDATISEIKDDPIFGKSVTISNQDLSMTYQSLGEVSVKKGDSVHVSDVIAKAGKNIYNKELGNHLHVVVEKDGSIIDPKLIYDKTVSEIK